MLSMKELTWWNSFSAQGVVMDINQIVEEILNELSLSVDSVKPGDGGQKNLKNQFISRP